MAKYPKNESSVRPYRLWREPGGEGMKNADRRGPLPYRNYVYTRSAHIGALIDAKWELKPGEAIEVYNTLNARSLGQYVRTPTAILFFPPGKEANDPQRFAEYDGGIYDQRKKGE